MEKKVRDPNAFKRGVDISSKLYGFEEKQGIEPSESVTKVSNLINSKLLQ